MYRRSLRFAPTVAAAVLATITALLGPTASARADVKVVREQTLTGLEELGAKGIPVTSACYYKGDKYREELVGRSIVHIYDCGKDRYYTINKTDQTYSIQTLDEALKKGGDNFLSKLNFKGKALITEGGTTRTIANRKANNYAVQTAILVTDQQHGARVLGVKIEGEQWTTRDIPFPSQCPNIRRLAYLFAPEASRLLEPYMEKVGDIKGMPLSFDYIVTINGARSATIEAHSDVKSVSTATIPDYMFRVPSGYKLVDKVAEED